MTNNYAYNPGKYSTHTIIAGLVGRSQTVLDVGCNDGYIGQAADRSNTFYGLDYAPESIKKVKKFYQDAQIYDLNQLRALPWKMDFSVIILADVLEHLNNPEMVLGYFVKKYLKPGGRVIVSLPNIANWQVRWRLLFGRFNYTEQSGIMDRTHLHFYTFDSARLLAAGAGLEVEAAVAGASVLGPIAKLLPFLRGLVATNIIIVGKLR